MSRSSAGITLAPPAIYLIFILFAAALSAALPAPLPWPPAAGFAGWALIASGVALMVWAVAVMFARRTTVNPYGCPGHLVDSGPFGLSRNPIYLGDTLVYAGIALLLGSLWPWLLLPALVACMNKGVIEREERLLLELFGETYQAYQARVRRWL